MTAPIPRRDFVQMSACAVLAGGLGGCASLVTVPVESRGGRLRVMIRNHPQLAAPGGFLRIQPPSDTPHLLVLALEGDDYAVVSPVCTHRQCITDVAGPRIVCPCHGSDYDRTGEVVKGPAERALTRFPAEVSSDGELVIQYGAR